MHVLRQNMSNRERLVELQLRQHQANTRFIILKISLYVIMFLAFAVTIVQTTLIYTQSDFAGESPMNVSALAFAESQ